MHYLIDIGSSTVKVYQSDRVGPTLLLARTFPFREGFDPESGLSQTNLEGLIDFLTKIKVDFSLTRGNAKLFATGIFRDLTSPRSLVERVYAATGLFFNIVSHELESFYLETAWTGQYHDDEPLLVINIGGKTTELVLFQGRESVRREMLDLGVGTIIREFAGINDPVSRVQLGETVRSIKSWLPPAEEWARSAVYTGGELTYMRLASYDLKANALFDDSSHPVSIGLADYSRRNAEVFSDVTLESLHALMPSNPSWMDGARPCSALAQAICEHYGVETIVPSDSNLIDGVNRREARNVVLCGSFRKHLGQITEIAGQLRESGYEVLSPKSTTVVGAQGDFVLFEGDEIVNSCTWSVEALHLRAIDEADLVLICNFNDYVGPKTALEIGYAYRSGKKVVFLEDGPVVDDFDLPSEVGLLPLLTAP